jgi:hypothetical protein
MSTHEIDWTLFETIEQVVAELVARRMYRGVHKPLSKIARESEDIIAVLDQIETLVEYLASGQDRDRLPDAWRKDSDAQLYELRVAYGELLDVVTSILPQQALEILRDKMH